MSTTDLMTPAEVARRLRVSMRHVRRMQQAGELDAVKLGPNTVRYFREQVDALVARGDK